MLILEFRYKRQATATIFEVELHNMAPRETFAIALRKIYMYTVTGIVADLPTNLFSCLPGSSAPFLASEGDLKRSRRIVHLKQRG